MHFEHLIQTFRDILRQVSLFDPDDELVAAADEYLDVGSVQSFSDVMRLAPGSDAWPRIVACFAEHGLYVGEASMAACTTRGGSHAI